MHQSSSVNHFAVARATDAQRADRFGQLRWFLLVALTAALVFTGIGHAYGQSAAAATYDAKIARGHILVGKKQDSTRAEFESVMKAAGGQTLGTLAGIGVDVVSVPAGKEKDYVARLKANPHVEFAELDQVMQAAATVNDPSVGSEWHIAKIHAPAAWDYTLGAGVKIAILDTGVDGTHPDLANQMVAGWNFYDNNNNTADVNGHGTAVAGAAAATANNAIGVAGVAGGARIMPLRIADANAYTLWSTAAQAINYAADNGARVVNMSYVGAAGSSTIQAAANYLRSKGGVLFVSAGNSGALDTTAPTTAMTVVGATLDSDTIASFSTFGNFVALSAPGYNILTTTRGGGYQYWWGTSLSSPIAAGVAALVIAKRPDFSAAQIDATLSASAVDLGTPGVDIYFGAGRVDAGAAVALAAGTPAGDTTSPTVSIASPGAGTKASGTIAVSVSAADNVGVTRVNLKVNGTIVGSATASPFAFAWNSTTVADGPVTLTAVAYDAAGNTATSSGVAISVANAPAVDTTPPTVSITSPSSGTSVSGQVTIAASASDNVGVNRVDFRVNGVTQATSNSAPYQFSWSSTQVANGAATLTAVAYDAAGNVAQSAGVVINVANALSPPASGDTSPPTITISNPVNGAYVSGPLTIKATATDNYGATGLSQKLYIDGVLKATATGGSITFSWNPKKATAGVHTIAVTARDAAGNTSTKQVQVTRK